MNHVKLMELVRSRQIKTYHIAHPSLREISRQCGVTVTSFTRLSKNQNMSADALLKLLLWLRRTGPETMDAIITAITQPKNGKKEMNRNGASARKITR